MSDGKRRRSEPESAGSTSNRRRNPRSAEASQRSHFVIDEIQAAKAALKAPLVFVIPIVMVGWMVADIAASVIVGFALGAAGGSLEDLEGLPFLLASTALTFIFMPRSIRLVRWILGKAFPLYL